MNDGELIAEVCHTNKWKGQNVFLNYGDWRVITVIYSEEFLPVLRNIKTDEIRYPKHLLDFPK